jgi:tripartite-type tricarboxylate transporter receptor subunit TctC
MKSIFAAVAAASLCALAPLSVAQTWPAHPIKLVVPFPAGGSTDAVARAVAQQLSQSLGQQVVIDNKPGAGGSIGANAVAASKPDGYTIGLATSSTHPAAVVLQENLPYDPIKSFTPITQIGRTAFILVGSNELKAKNLPELIALAKDKPDTLAFADVGTSTLGYLLTQQFAHLTGTKFIHVTYKGSAQAYPDLMAGRVAVLFDNPGTSTAFVNNGKLQNFGVTIPTPAIAGAPLFSETGAKHGLGAFNTAFWYGLVAPAGTPPEIVARIQSEVAQYVHSDAGKKDFAAMSLEPVGSKPEAFAETIGADIQRYKQLKQSLERSH